MTLSTTPFALGHGVGLSNTCCFSYCKKVCRLFNDICGSIVNEGFEKVLELGDQEFNGIKNFVLDGREEFLQYVNFICVARGRLKFLDMHVRHCMNKKECIWIPGKVGFYMQFKLWNFHADNKITFRLL